MIFASHAAPSRRMQASSSAFAVMPKAFAGVNTGRPWRRNGAADLRPLNTFVKIGTDDTVTILSKHIEFGQGPFTGLATLVAEELDADWSQMRAVHSPADDKVYANLMFGMQGTGGSTAIANSYEQYRQAGATARAMLVSCGTRNGVCPRAKSLSDAAFSVTKASGKEPVGSAPWPTGRQSRRRRPIRPSRTPRTSY